MLCGGLFWWLNSRSANTEESEGDCVYLSELTEDELFDLMTEKIEMETKQP